jgi:hypothetical protein
VLSSAAANLAQHTGTTMEGYIGVLVHRQHFLLFRLLHLPRRYSRLVSPHRHDCSIHFHLYYCM